MTWSRQYTPPDNLPVLVPEETGEDGLPQSVEIIDDALALRIPLGPDDSDNYVVGALIHSCHVSLHVGRHEQHSQMSFGSQMSWRPLWQSYSDCAACMLLPCALRAQGCVHRRRCES